MKRLFDLTLIFLSLPLLLPLYLVVAWLVRSKLGAPILFRQIRPGKNIKPFEMIKFRTMTDGRDSNGELLPDSLRLTKVGQFISMKIEKNNYMPENTPHSIAAGVVYFIAQICNLNITKRDVKNVCEISEVTINKCFKKIEKLTDELMPAVILKKYSH